MSLSLASSWNVSDHRKNQRNCGTDASLTYFTANIWLNVKGSLIASVDSEGSGNLCVVLSLYRPSPSFCNAHKKSPHVQNFRFSRICSINLIIVFDIRSKNRRYDSPDGRCVWCRILFTIFKYRKLVEVHRMSRSLIFVCANNDVNGSEMTLKDVMNRILWGNSMEASPSFFALVSVSYWYFHHALGPSHPCRYERNNYFSRIVQNSQE